MLFLKLSVENVLKFIPEYMFSWVKNLFFNILSILLITMSLCTPLRAFSEKTRQILETRIHHGDDFCQILAVVLVSLDQIKSQIFCCITFCSQVMAIFSLQMTLPEMEKSEKLEIYLNLFLQLQQTSATVFSFHHC